MKKRFIEAVSQRARIFSLALVFAMVIQSFGIVPKVYADDGNLDVSEGNITITKDGYKIGEEEEILYTGAYIIISGLGSDTSVANAVTVESGEHDITLNGVNISSSSTSPFSISAGAEVNLTIEGTNTLKSTAQNYSGIAVPTDAKLTITADSTGSLSVTGAVGGRGIGGGGEITIDGGDITVQGGAYNAGIDGTGGVTINGGTVTAIGGSSGGAGIGGSYLTSNGSVTITGGYVVAKSLVRSNGAGIGGGYRSNGGTITISGGTVVAIGDDSAAGIGGGEKYQEGGAGGTITITGGTVMASGGVNGIGDGSGGSGGTFSTGDDGNAFIVATKITDTSGQESEWSGAIIIGNTGKVYGDTVTLGENAEIPSGKTLTIGEDKELVVGADITLKNSGTLINSGVLTDNGTLMNSGLLTIQDHDGTIDRDDYASRFSGTGKLEGDGEYKITNIDIIENYINTDGLTYTGNDLTKEIELKEPPVLIMGQTFTAEFTNWNASADFYKAVSGTKGSSVSEVIDAGDYIVEYTKNDNSTTVSKSFSVSQTENEWISELTMEDWTYGNEPSEPNATAKFGDVQFKYSDSKDGTYTETAPTTAGTWYVKAIVVGNESYISLESAPVAYEILQAAASYDMPTTLKAIYGQTLKDVSLPKAENGKWDWVDDEGTFVGDVGQPTFAATFTPYDTKNYAWAKVDGWDSGGQYVKVDLTVLVSEAENEWTTWPKIASWTYGEDASDPVAAALFGDVVVDYRLKSSSDDDYTGTKPSDAGEYYARFTVEGTNNYSGLEEFVEFTIAQATPTIDDDYLEYTAIYGDTFEVVGKDLTKPNDVTGNPFTEGSWTWTDADKTSLKDSDTVGDVTAGNEYRTFYATFTADGDDNYTSAEFEVRIRVTPKVIDLDFTVPTGNDAVYDRAAKKAVCDLKNGYTLVGDTSLGDVVTLYYSGTLTMDAEYPETTAPPTQAGSYTVTAKCTDNYYTFVDGEMPSATFTIERGTLTASDFEITQPSNSMYNGDAWSVIVSIASTSIVTVDDIGEITVHYYKDGSKVTSDAAGVGGPIDAGEYTVKLSVEAGKNYKATDVELGSEEWTLTIIQAQTVITNVGYGTEDEGSDARLFYYNSEPIDEPAKGEHFSTESDGEMTFTWYKKSDPSTALDANETPPTAVDDYILLVKTEANNNYTSEELEVEVRIVNIDTPDPAYTLTGGYGPDANGVYWIKEGGTAKIVPPAGYNISTSTDSFATELSYSSEQSANSIKIRLRDGSGYITDEIHVKESIKIDSTSPTGTIKIGESEWTEFSEEVKLDTLLAGEQTVTLEGDDAMSKVQSIEYYLSNERLDASGVANISDWTKYDEPFNILPANSYIIYVKITDNAGNETIINSGGLVLYTVINSDDGAYKNQESMTDDGINLESNTVTKVKVDGETLTEGEDYVINDDGTLTLTDSYIKTLPDGSHEIEITYTPSTTAEGVTPSSQTATIRFEVEPRINPDDYTDMNQDDVQEGIDLKGGTVVEVKVNGKVLTEGEDYIVADGKVKLTDAFIKTLATGTYTLEISYRPSTTDPNVEAPIQTVILTFKVESDETESDEAKSSGTESAEAEPVEADAAIVVTVSSSDQSTASGSQGGAGDDEDSGAGTGGDSDEADTEDEEESTGADSAKGNQFITGAFVFGLVALSLLALVIVLWKRRKKEEKES